MVWKSNLDENEVELIEDLAARQVQTASIGTRKAANPAAVDPSNMRSVAQTQHRMTAPPKST